MRLVLLFLFLCTPLAAFAQKEAAYWYFGNKAGLRFIGKVPEALTYGSLVTESATATVSDRETGALLFYTNGRNTWDRQHRLMPGSDTFEVPCPSAISQPALIMPVPGSEHRYYVFSVRFSAPADHYNCIFGYIDEVLQPSYSCELRYSIVDMRLNGGSGDIVASEKDVLLQGNITEKLTAIPHANGSDFWLLTHEWNSDAFLVQKVSAAGVAAEPSVQRIGSAHRSRTYAGKVSNSEIRGMMKPSPDGTMLACAVDFEEGRPFDLFDFDASTGTLSNYRSLGDLEAQYGVSFSPDNSKLYVSCLSPRNTAYKDVIRQYDLSLQSVEAVVASGKSIIQGNPDTNIPPRQLGTGYYDLQIGPDGRIYGTSHHVYSGPEIPGNHTMLVIGQPNAPGYSCRVNLVDFDFGDGNVALGLPNFIQSYFNGLEPEGQEPVGCTPEALQVYPNPTGGNVRFGTAGDCDFNQRFDLMVVNVIGQQVVPLKEGVTAGQEVDISGLADGLYLFCLTFPDDRVVVRKVVKVSL